MKNSIKNKMITPKRSRKTFSPKSTKPGMLWVSAETLRWDKILSDPKEARECLQKVLDADMFELQNASSVDSLSDEQVFSLMKDIRTHIENLEEEERELQ